MGNIGKPPGKQAIRSYLQDRLKTQAPPPSMDEIRRQLGWNLINGQSHPARSS